MREFAERFYKSKAWQNNRDLYAKSVHGLCEDCLAKGELVPGQIVHHLVELTPENINDPAVTMAWTNLRLVCRDHHKQYHPKGRPRRYCIDQSGRIVLRDIPPCSDLREAPRKTGGKGSEFLSHAGRGVSEDGKSEKRDPDQAGTNSAGGPL